MPIGTKVAFNTFVMYAKVLITVGIALYSTRLILRELGESDFGAFNLMAGIIGMLAFLNYSTMVATQRYMSYALGMNDKEQFFEIFRISKKLSLCLGVLVVVIIEIFGFFFLDKLNIVPERLFAVQVVFQCTVASTFFSILAIPYEAEIFVNEDIFVISLLYIAESFLKLGVAIYLIYSPFDKLVVYGILMALLCVFSNICKKIYCGKYEKSRIKKKPDKKLFFEMAKFSGWTSFESLSGLFSVQGIAVILNLFGGTVVNAAYGIANQVSGQMNYFSASLLGAINPQIMKSEGRGDSERTLRLSMFACKISFFLLAFFSLPLIVEMPYVLRIWLKDVPTYTVLFCRLILISLLVSQLAYGLQGGIQAVGKIKNYQTALGIVRLLALPVVYVLLKMNLSVYIAVFSFIFVEIIIFFIRLYFASRLLKMNKINYLLTVFLQLVSSFVLVYLFLQSVLYFFSEESFLRLLMIIFVSSVALLIMLKMLILNKEEYCQVKNVCCDFIKRKNRNYDK